jgi:hypothetical protein
MVGYVSQGHRLTGIDLIDLDWPPNPPPFVPLASQDYDSALRLAAGAAQRDTVYRTMAEESYAAGNFRAAAGQWGKVVGGRPGFEEVALQLVGCGDPEALQVFLEAKLKVSSGPPRKPYVPWCQKSQSLVYCTR